MMSNASENKRLAKNTILLYGRTILTVIIGLYTSRVILKELGISDFGLFNAVGGMVAMFTFLNNALSGSSQRFISFSLGREDISQTIKLFQVLLTLHLLIAISFFLFLEILGGIMLHNLLNIPEGRETAAFWVFQFCTVSVCIDMVRMLLDADVIANEKMNFYAYISILEVIIKLFIVFCLSWLDYDKLITYSTLFLLATIMVFLAEVTYCMKQFKECRLSLSFNRFIMKDVATYAGWNTMSHISFMTITQGVNVAINVFLGTVVNAARGVAVQVSGVVTRLTNNYLTAAMPQIVKLYASGDISGMSLLVTNVSKFSAYLYLLLVVPLYLEINYLLNLWLVEVPFHSILFVRVFLVQGLIIAFANPLTRIISATGEVKMINIFDSCTQIIVFLIITLLLYSRVNVDYVMTLLVVPNFLGFFAYLYFAHIQAGYKPVDFLYNAILPITKVTICTIIIPILIYYNMEESFLRLIIISLSSSLSLCFSVLYLGVNKETRNIVYHKIVNYFKNNRYGRTKL